MADEQNNSTKVKTVIDDMASRREFDSTDAAAAYIVECFQNFADFGNYNIVSPYDASRGVAGFGQDESGNLVFDPEIFPADFRVGVSVLTQRGEGAGSSTVKGIVIYPIPTREAILSSEAGLKWLDKILSTELNRIAVRGLRAADANITDLEVLDQMPKSLDDYVTSNRGGGSALAEAYEKLWKIIRDAIGKQVKAWKLANLSKKELKNAIQSKAHAAQYYPTLEETKQGSLFVFAAMAMKQEAIKAGMDASIFDSWLAGRDAYVIDANEEEEEGELSLESLLISTDEEAPAEAPAAE